jgi:hypothetical protein
LALLKDETDVRVSARGVDPFFGGRLRWPDA